MKTSQPLPVHPDIIARSDIGAPPTIAELVDPDQGLSRCHVFAGALRGAGADVPASGGVIYAFVRWLDAVLKVTDSLVGQPSAARLAAALDDDLGPRERARLRNLLAADVSGFLTTTADSGPSPDAATRPDGPSDLVPMTALMLCLLNPAAAAPASWLGLDAVALAPDAGRMFTSLRRGLERIPAPDGQASVLQVLELPVLHAPDRLDEQLLIAADAWRPWLGDDADHCARAAGVIREESRPHFDGPGEAPVFEAPEPASEAPPTDEAAGGASYAPADDPEAEVERFSADRDWMPRLILLAKNTHVWLHQLSERHGRAIDRLDLVPDEELDAMAARGVTGLWLIGLWQRSAASREIKRRSGNPEALSSAYAVDDYRIADDLGGDGAFDDLSRRALERGIRMCGDMVPNHTGIDARWVLERPELFLSLDHSPYPGYTFDGPELSTEPQVSIRIEDHYWEHSDASVVFRREDRATGDVRFIYHGNDGTAMPWNDTAQLDFLNPETREAVIGTIIDVARRFPVIRFDAAMVLARRHLRRLWHPAPGQDSDIPTRAARALSPEDFDRAMPAEFWREVVDRVAAEAPDTLLLAEAFWLMEGYFVRTLGMHRVYNSAFMHMLRDQDNAKFRQGLKNVLAHDPRVLQRFVNFMSNPDEETAVEQFGTGDKYFGVATLLATLPGLPLIGHGQLEGFSEKYGMEYARAYRDEEPDAGFMEHHDRMISPLFHKREIFAGADDFRLFDLRNEQGDVVEDMIAYANRNGKDAALVVVNNCHERRRGRLHRSWAGGDAAGERLDELLGLRTDAGGTVRLRDPRNDVETTVEAGELRDRGLEIELPPYGAAVYLEWSAEARSV